MGEGFSVNESPFQSMPSSLRKRPRFLRWLVATSLLVATWSACQRAQNTSPITVSKETTYITEPLRADGRPDYERWLLEKYRAGVTPKNNAGALLFQAIWPGELEPQDYESVRKELGLPMAPSTDGALQDIHDESLSTAIRKLLIERGVEIDDDNSVVEDVVDSTIDTAWTSKDLPPMVTWLVANEEPLNMVVEASRRSRFYMPSPSLLNDKHEMLIEMLLPGAQGVRYAVRALSIRAMWHLGEGRLVEAWGDLSAVNRLACLATQGRTTVEKLVAVACHGIAQKATIEVLSDQQITPELARQIQTNLSNAKFELSMAETLGTSERVSTLDSVIHMELYGFDVLADGGGKRQRSNKSAIFDWNVVLRNLNRRYDQLAAAAAIDDFEDRQQACSKFESDMRASEEERTRFGTRLKAAISRQTRSEAFSATVAALMFPAVGAALSAESRDSTMSQLTQLAAALAVYRADHGHYPDKIDSLVPDVLPKLPLDLYHAKPFIYTREADGYLLYCTGENGVDDGGSHVGWDILAGRDLGWNDDPATEELRQQIPAGADDLSIRVPRPPFQLPTPPARD